MMTREELVQELMSIFSPRMRHEAETDAREEVARTFLSQDPDTPEILEVTRLQHEMLKASRQAVHNTIVNSGLTDAQLQEVLDFHRSPVGQAWFQTRLKMYDATIPARLACANTVAVYLANACFAKLARCIAYVVHDMDRNLSRAEVVDKVHKYLNLQPLISMPISHEGWDNAYRVINTATKEQFVALYSFFIRAAEPCTASYWPVTE
jgi:hypothetical protein